MFSTPKPNLQAPLHYDDGRFETFYFTEKKHEGVRYKLRINLDRKCCTPEKKQEIAELLISLNQKFSTPACLVLEAFKLVSDEPDPEVLLLEKRFKFWENIINNQNGLSVYSYEELNEIADRHGWSLLLGQVLQPKIDINSEYDEKGIALELKKIETDLKLVKESRLRMENEAQFTLYLSLNQKNQNGRAMLSLGFFVKELESELSKRGFKPAEKIAETDWRISPYLSFRQENLEDGVYIPFDCSEPGSLQQLKAEQYNSKVYKFLISGELDNGSDNIISVSDDKAQNPIADAVLAKKDIQNDSDHLKLFKSKSKSDIPPSLTKNQIKKSNCSIS